MLYLGLGRIYIQKYLIITEYNIHFHRLPKHRIELMNVP